MIALASGLRVYLACGVTDMRKGATGLAMLVQQGLSADPFDGAVFAFRGRRAGLIKLIWHDGIGLCMLTKRLEQGQFEACIFSLALLHIPGTMTKLGASRRKLAGRRAQNYAERIVRRHMARCSF